MFISSCVHQLFLRLGSHMCGRGFVPGVRCVSVHRLRSEFLPEFAPEPDPDMHRTLLQSALALCEPALLRANHANWMQKTCIHIAYM